MKNFHIPVSAEIRDSLLAGTGLGNAAVFGKLSGTRRIIPMAARPEFIRVLFAQYLYTHKVRTDDDWQSLIHVKD